MAIVPKVYNNHDSVEKKQNKRLIQAVVTVLRETTKRDPTGEPEIQGKAEAGRTSVLTVNKNDPGRKRKTRGKTPCPHLDEDRQSQTSIPLSPQEPRVTLKVGRGQVCEIPGRPRNSPLSPDRGGLSL